jgi:hypothetical protein
MCWLAMRADYWRNGRLPPHVDADGRFQVRLEHALATALGLGFYPISESLSHFVSESINPAWSIPGQFESG